jgi:uncharacterized membrane protein
MNKLFLKASWIMLFFLAILIGLYALSVAFIPIARNEFVTGILEFSFLGSFLHFLGGGIVIIVGASQFSKKLRTNKPTLHRTLGEIYISGVLVGGFSGFYLALYSSGGMARHYGFALLAIAWLSATVIAYNCIRKRDIAAHQRWMIRSYALTLAAVTLRLYIPAFLISGASFEEAYPLIAWLCWVPNILIAEWVLIPKLVKRL